jgi:hypothetical protein
MIRVFFEKTPMSQGIRHPKYAFIISKISAVIPKGNGNFVWIIYPVSQLPSFSSPARDGRTGASF